jgi:chromosome partitioning protein
MLNQKGGHIDWIVMRNRLSHLDARNKRDMEKLLDAMSKRLGCRIVAGFGERVIYRELFLKGLTMMDLSAEELSMSHLAARQEVRTLIESINLPCLD